MAALDALARGLRLAVLEWRALLLLYVANLAIAVVLGLPLLLAAAGAETSAAALAVPLALLLVWNGVFELARVSMVGDDQRRARGGVRRAFALVLRRPAAFLLLWLALAALDALTLGVAAFA